MTTSDRLEKYPAMSNLIDWYYERSLGARRKYDYDFLIKEFLSALEEIDQLRLALKLLYEETADYITVNNLGDVHHNHSMQLAQKALSANPEPKC